MKLTGLCQKAGLPTPKTDREILNLPRTAEEADGMSLFVCIKGAKRDGHTLAPEAYRRGCRCFVAEDRLNLPGDAEILQTADPRLVQALLADAFFDHPSGRLRVVGVTGTKGKTTTAWLLSGLLNRAGIRTGYIGTNGIFLGERSFPSANTTPDPVTLQKALSDMAKEGIEAAVVEVSSQALKQKRIDGTRFEAVLFTNLFPDHIGPLEHPDFEDYRACKKRLFSAFGVKNAVVNRDDPHTDFLLSEWKGNPPVTFGKREGADYRLIQAMPRIADGKMGIAYTVGKAGEAREEQGSLLLCGEVNAENALLALAAAESVFGVALPEGIRRLEEVSVPGRSEQIALPMGAFAVIDYAHNGGSLRALLTSLRAYRPNRIVCLFGSVGERTRARRRELGEVAAELADYSVLTSDNPGNEDPKAIIAEIAEPFRERKKPYCAVPDRAEAIRYALTLVGKGDFLVLAGKGHETGQRIGNVEIPFSEKEILKAAVDEMEKEPV